MKLLYTIKETYYHEYFYSVPIKGKEYLLCLSECGFDEPRNYYRVSIVTDTEEYTFESFSHFIVKRWKYGYVEKRYYNKPDLHALAQTEKITKHLPEENIRSEILNLAQHYKPWVNPCNTISDYIEEKLQLNIKEANKDWVTLQDSSRLLVLRGDREEIKIVELHRSLLGDFFVAGTDEYLSGAFNYATAKILEEVVHALGVV